MKNVEQIVVDHISSFAVTFVRCTAGVGFEPRQPAVVRPFTITKTASIRLAIATFAVATFVVFAAAGSSFATFAILALVGAGLASFTFAPSFGSGDLGDVSLNVAPSLVRCFQDVGAPSKATGTLGVGK